MLEHRRTGAMRRKNFMRMISHVLAMTLLFCSLAVVQIVAAAKLDCTATTNTSIALPRTVAIASNLPGTGAHALASALSAVASKVTTMSAKVQPYNGPNAWMPLLEEGEIE